ncbi:hypothetical protein [Methanosarcina sp. WWM596]|uniref:hypothetical protein n=1 Tax=Methanosarcina sp. WWM596 TaxID=1434103 RepID=UPI0006157B71|nr:hypothetical protein [Methanosarcina sp. WWM596]AKB19057.1 hypothetical protein MSWHS_2194 [Methanosarcina sp. WWM596]
MTSEQRKTSFEQYVCFFFNDLEIYEDLNNNKEYKQEIITAVRDFLKSADVDSAYKVYESFFKAYWIGTSEKENPFLILIEKMKNFEKLAGRLTSKQRDHYVHSAFVFLIGIAIYQQNSKYKKTFEEYALCKNKYLNPYDTNNEEFFYRWGLASLFHDIAYPLEITLEQIKNYANFICSYPKEKTDNLKVTLELCNFEEFIKLPTINPDPKYEKDFMTKYPNYKEEFPSDAIGLLSKSITTSFSLNFNEVNNNINYFMKAMKEDNFIDHGLYSSVIMLRWYHYLVKSTKWNPAYFYYPIVDAASAIFLHNYFGHLIKSFDLEPLHAKDHPVAYLLILCDNLQEWKREFYGQDSSKNKYPSTDFDISITDYKLEIIYKLPNSCSEYSDPSEIKEKVNKLLTIDDVFEEYNISIKEG